MTDLPKKALLLSQFLDRKKSAEDLAPSGHEVEKVTFLDADDVLKTGFFKPLNESYPALLAKYCVAISVLVRLSLGDKAAEERLVFDKVGRIVGTVSRALTDAQNKPCYKPLQSRSMPIPTDPQEKEQVCPSLNTLMVYNVAEFLVSMWRHQCPDRHPDNFSLFGVLDYDSCFYPETQCMRGASFIERVFGTNPQESMALKTTEIDNAPILARTHWPTNELPGNGNLAKRYPAEVVAAFRKLAENPTLETEGNISFQEQFFAACLQELLCYEPEMLRVQLTDYLGELTLDFLSPDLDDAEKIKMGQHLGCVKSEALSKEKPKYFNVKANSRSFIDHIMEVIQDKYDDFYRIVVFYSGCPKNIVGKAVMGFDYFLCHRRGSAFNKIWGWAEAQNKKMALTHATEAGKEARTTKKETTEEGEVFVSHPYDNTYCIAPEGRYQKEKMLQRLHQILRDAHLPRINNFLFELKQLAYDLTNAQRLQPLEASIKQSSPQLREEPITAAWQGLDLGPISIDLSTEINSDENSRVRQGLKFLIDTINSMKEIMEAYYKTPRNKLNFDVNGNFIQKMTMLLFTLSQNGPNLLGAAGWNTKLLLRAIDALNNPSSLHSSLHFVSFLGLPAQPFDKEVKQTVVYRHHSDPAIVIACFEQLFQWAAQFDRLNNHYGSSLNNIILSIIKEHYEPYYLNYLTLANRNRAPLVRSYLEKTKDRGDMRLAWILSAGDTKKNSLNTLLIIHLIPQMLKATLGHVNDNLLSLRNAHSDNKFTLEDAILYAQRGQHYVLTNEYFKDFYYSKENIECLNQLMYLWVAEKPRGDFEDLVLEAIKTYQALQPPIKSLTKGLTSWFYTPTREEEIAKLLVPTNRDSNQRILARIFLQGGLEKNSLNTLLFKEILVILKGENENPLFFQALLSMMNKGEDFAPYLRQLIVAAEVRDDSCPLLLSLAEGAKAQLYASNPSRASVKSVIASSSP